MANKKPKSKTKTKIISTTAEDSNVTRIKASDSAPPKKSVAKEVIKSVVAKKPAVQAPVKTADKPATAAKKRRFSPKSALKTSTKPARAAGGYFKGAWDELRQVRWPTRRATWGLTGAVLAFSAFFIIIILLLDAGFKYIFELILKK